MGHHRIHLDGRELSTWCAWDTLFLPEPLGGTARVTSRCPVTGEEISLTVNRSGPTDVHPADAVVSFLVPETAFDENVIQSFCRFVHFFASPQAGERWIAEHPGTFLLSVADAFELGRRTNQRRLGAALGRRRIPGVTGG
jgi:alkylmercury lyase